MYKKTIRKINQPKKTNKLNNNKSMNRMKLQMSSHRFHPANNINPRNNKTTTKIMNRGHYKWTIKKNLLKKQMILTWRMQLPREVKEKRKRQMSLKNRELL